MPQFICKDPGHAGRNDRSGFTLIELLVVIGIIMALMALSFPVISQVMSSGAVGGTQVLVDSVHAAIDKTPERTVSGTDGIVRRMWDFNGDNIIDGEPALDPGFSTAQRTSATACNYKGFIASSRSEWQGSVEPATRRLVDAWRRPLHIAFSTTAYGSSWFGVWSDGKDMTSGTADDIVSWKH
jgi:prepilin-type N-terminal cleavage/methylation domain-containing protein